MDQLADFEEYYNSTLTPSLERLRRECKTADTWGFISLAAGVLVFSAFIGFTANFLPGVIAVLIIICFGVLLIISVYNYGKNKDRFTDDYKISVIKTIINHLCPGATYKPDKYVSHKQYIASSLLRQYYDWYSGDDYISGSHNNVPFHCSEIESGTNDNVTVFSGLFIVADTYAGHGAGTYVWDRDFEQLPASLADQYRLMPMRRIYDVHFNDPGFNEYFRVCSTHPTEAHAILTEERRRNIVDFVKAMDIHLAFSFVGGRFYAAIPAQDELLEPTDYDPGDKTEIKRYFYTINLVLNIIDRLQLNRY